MLHVVIVNGLKCGSLSLCSSKRAHVKQLQECLSQLAPQPRDQLPYAGHSFPFRAPQHLILYQLIQQELYIIVLLCFIGYSYGMMHFGGKFKVEVFMYRVLWVSTLWLDKNVLPQLYHKNHNISRVMLKLSIELLVSGLKL